MAMASTPVEIFCSYAHEDEEWLRKLEIHLSLLQRQGLISLWHDRLIAPGTDWAKTIDTQLETASVILLLVSADFFASNYCYGIEMKRVLERQEAGEARVIPILVRPVDWTGAPFAYLQPLPTDAKPLATWRNQDTALADITAGLRRVIVEDLPQLTASAPHAALPAIWNIPYPRNPFFLGRETELALVRHHLQAGQATALSQPQAISGLGGIGKTQLSLEYAYRYSLDYQMVLWARSETTEALISSYVAIATLLRLPEREVKEQEIIVQAVKTWLQTHRGWLLILDNADELALLPDFLPPSLGGHLLLTTRAAATGRLAHRLEIEVLLPDHGALFLLRRAALIAPNATLGQASQEEQELAVQISQELGGLPLALDQAGAYLEETGTDLVSYWHIYQRHRADLLRERRGLVADHPAPVATTWSLSFQKVEEKNAAAADLLRLCVFLSPDAIPEEILTVGASFLGPALAQVAANAFRLNQAIESLRAYSLLGRDPRTHVLSVHRLVQAVLHDAMDEQSRKEWAERAVHAIFAAFPLVEHQNWPQWDRLLPHAQRGTDLIKAHDMTFPEAVLLLNRTGIYLQARARYQEAEPLYVHALAIYEQRLGATHPDTAFPLNNLGTLYFQQGKYTQAEPLHHRALVIREQQLGAMHPETLQSLNNLAALYLAQGKYTQAEPLFQRALTIYEQQLGPAHPDTASTLNNLALLYGSQGKYAQAEPLCQRALAIREKQLGPEHPNTAQSLNNLALLYKLQEKYTRAEPLYQRALTIQEKQLGPAHPDTAQSLNNLAALYEALGKYEEAKLSFQRALTVREQALGREHPDTVTSMGWLAFVYQQQQQYREAELLYQRALSISAKTLGSGHPLTQRVQQSYIFLLLAMGHDDQARELEQGSG